MKLQIGKYKGQDIEEIPTEYLVWFEANTNPAPPLREALNAEIKIRTADEASIGKDVEGPSYQSFESMLYDVLIKWLVNEHTIRRIQLPLDRTMLQTSLVNLLKNEVPRLKKLHRSQTKI